MKPIKKKFPSIDFIPKSPVAKPPKEDPPYVATEDNRRNPPEE